MPLKTKQNRDRIRMAVRVYERLSESRKPAPLFLPVTQWLECERWGRLLAKTIDRGWLAAASRIRPRLERALRELQANLTQILSDQKPSAVPFSLREVHSELVGLYDEYPHADCNLRRNTISVITDSITLEQNSLGPFCIALDVGTGGDRLGYSVIATDPHPAGNDQDVTHPHVRDNGLCEGEGTRPIRQAVADGRLGDFFHIVDQILHTYNPGSAYVALEEWQGICCAACGVLVDGDQRTRCSGTSDPLCYECAVTCPDCDREFAPDLIERCERCQEHHCDRCLEEGICHACCEEIREEETLAPRQTETASGGCGGCSAGVGSTEAAGSAIG